MKVLWLDVLGNIFQSLSHYATKNVYLMKVEIKIVHFYLVALICFSVAL